MMLIKKKLSLLGRKWLRLFIYVMMYHCIIKIFFSVEGSMKAVGTEIKNYPNTDSADLTDTEVINPFM